MKLDPLVNQRVRFKLHESPETFEATILGYDETGYWVRGGSLSEYLRQTERTEDESPDTRFVEFRRIRSIQKAT